jgi:hypothetical protein
VNLYLRPKFPSKVIIFFVVPSLKQIFLKINFLFQRSERKSAAKGAVKVAVELKFGAVKGLKRAVN